MENSVGVGEFFRKLGSQKQAKFLLSKNPIIEMRSSGPSSGKEDRVGKMIKITPVERVEDAYPIYAIHILLGGLTTVLANGAHIGNHPQIKDKSFKFEWVK